MKAMKSHPSEHQIQSAFIKIVDLHLKTYPQLELLFAVPNAAKRSPALAAMMKAEGMRSGVPDIMFPYANGTHYGLALEFKSAKGKPTDNQIEWMGRLDHYGWICYVVKDAQEAWDIVLQYLKNKE